MNSSALVLVVEDEAKIASALVDWLQASGFRTAHLDRGDLVAGWVREYRPDAILLDLMLPGEDGLSVCRRLRADSNVPILMLTARVEEIDRLLGLEVGADDYICKPYSLREVISRLRAVLRRSGAAPSVAAQPSLDHDRFELRLERKSVALTPVEFRVLERLMSHPGKVFSRRVLTDVAYTDHRVVSDATLDSHVRNLRRKLVELGLPDAIGSVYGMGFRYCAP